MEDFRSKSCRDVRNMQMESYNYNKNNSNNYNGGGRGGGGGGGRQYGPTNMHDLRSFSTNNASSVNHQTPNSNHMMGVGKEVQPKKSKKGLGGSSSGKSWSFNDPELQRKKRVAGYKVYSVEGKMKGSFRKSFRWIKDIVFGWR